MQLKSITVYPNIRIKVLGDSYSVIAAFQEAMAQITDAYSSIAFIMILS